MCLREFGLFWRMEYVWFSDSIYKKNASLSGKHSFYAKDERYYSSNRISRILMAAVGIGVPGPKIAAAPALYSAS